MIDIIYKKAIVTCSCGYSRDKFPQNRALYNFDNILHCQNEKNNYKSLDVRHPLQYHAIDININNCKVYINIHDNYSSIYYVSGIETIDSSDVNDILTHILFN